MEDNAIFDTYDTLDYAILDANTVMSNETYFNENSVFNDVYYKAGEEDSQELPPITDDNEQLFYGETDLYYDMQRRDMDVEDETVEEWGEPIDFSSFNVEKELGPYTESEKSKMFKYLLLSIEVVDLLHKVNQRIEELRREELGERIVEPPTKRRQLVFCVYFKHFYKRPRYSIFKVGAVWLASRRFFSSAICSSVLKNICNYVLLSTTT